MSKCVQFKATAISNEKATSDETSFSGAAKSSKENLLLDRTPHTNQVGSSHAATIKNVAKACPTYSMPKAPWRSDHSHDSVDKGTPDGIKTVKDSSMNAPRALNRSPELDLSPRQKERHGHGEDGKEKGGVHLLAKSVSISVNGAVQSDENASKRSKCSDQLITMDRSVSCGLSIVEAELAKVHHVSNMLLHEID
jgi:hypothetical protein